MLSLKKTAVAVLVLSSSASFAGTMGSVCSAVNVTVPCESTAWHVGGQAIYLQPTTTANALNYTISAPNGTFSAVPKSWDWGFQLEGAYHYATGSDTNLNWYHLNNTKSKSAQGPFSYKGTPFAATATANITIDPQWDEVNLEFGQHIDVADMKSIRFHGGVQYARIDSTGSANLADPALATNNYYSQALSYNGFGPRVGMDFDYNWGNGVGIYARGAGSILAGTSKLTYTAIPTAAGGIQTVTSISGSTTTIVPELESKLGIKYDYAMAQGDLTLDFGWLWINYFNAQPNLTPSTYSVASGDFGLQGLYFGLKWMGNVV